MIIRILGAICAYAISMYVLALFGVGALGQLFIGVVAAAASFVLLEDVGQKKKKPSSSEPPAK